MKILQFSKIFTKSYFPATIIQALVSFAWMAFISRAISSAEFGIWILIEPALILCAHIALWGANHSIIKGYSSGDSNSKVLAITLLVKVVRPFLFMTALFFGCTIVFLGVLLSATFTILLAVEALFIYVLNTTRGLNFPQLYLKFIFSRYVILAISAATVYATVESASLLHYLLCSIFAILLSLCIPLFNANTRASLLPQKVQLRPDNIVECNSLLTYGRPLMINTVINFAFLNVDRYLVASILGLDVATNYAILHKCATAISLAISPINLWWPSARFRHLNKNNLGIKFFQEFSLNSLAYYLFFSVCLLSISPFLANILGLNRDYHPGIVPLLLLGLVAGAFSSQLSPGLLNTNSTRYIAITSLVVFCIHIVIIGPLTYLFGEIGAAATFAGSSTITCFSLYKLSQQHLRIAFPVKQISLLFLGTYTVAFVLDNISNSITSRLVGYFVALLLLAPFLISRLKNFSNELRE